MCPQRFNKPPVQRPQQHLRNNMASIRTMKLLGLLTLLGLVQAQDSSVCDNHPTNRPPLDSDISLTCGTDRMFVSIIICPIYQAAFTSDNMVLNQQTTNPECFGTADFVADPPVLNFEIPINPTAPFCGGSYEITESVGEGDFSDLSQVQYINVSGHVNSFDSGLGTITYRSQLQYLFSCEYPMQYLLKDQELAVSGVDIAIQDDGGSFISTLSMELFSDPAYSVPLFIPTSGLTLKTKIYVSVKATGLTERFNVLLDRCFATATEYPDNTDFYDLFVGCENEPQTTVELNGRAQEAQYNFEAFRFVVHNDLDVSTVYLHCITRLCEVDACPNLSECTVGPQQQRRRRRDTEPQDSVNGTLVTSAFRIKKEDLTPSSFSAQAASPEVKNHYSSPVVAVIICIVVLSILLVAMAVYFGFYIRRRH